MADRFTKKEIASLRVATKEDFKPGITLVTSEGYSFTISSKYDEGVWESRAVGGGKVLFECEAKFYRVAPNTDKP